MAEHLTKRFVDLRRLRLGLLSVSPNFALIMLKSSRLSLLVMALLAAGGVNVL